jgi:hypothetical protein
MRKSNLSLRRFSKSPVCLTCTTKVHFTLHAGTLHVYSEAHCWLAPNPKSVPCFHSVSATFSLVFRGTLKLYHFNSNFLISLPSFYLWCDMSTNVYFQNTLSDKWWKKLTMPERVRSRNKRYSPAFFWSDNRLGTMDCEVLMPAYILSMSMPSIG